MTQLIFKHEGLTMKATVEDRTATLYIHAWYKHSNGVEGKRYKEIHSTELDSSHTLLDAKRLLLDGLPDGP